MAEDPADLLRQRGIQVTAQRLAVLRAVQVSRTSRRTAWPMSRGSRSAPSRASPFTTPSASSWPNGLVRRIQPAGSPARFEARVGDNHHHVICRICGRTADVDCAAGSAPCLTAIDDRGYEIDEAEVDLLGSMSGVRVPRPGDMNPLRSTCDAGVEAEPRTARDEEPSSPCPTAAQRRRSERHGQREQVPGDGRDPPEPACGHDNPGLVAEPAEPADSSGRTTLSPIRWARSSTTPRSSRRSTSMP